MHSINWEGEGGRVGFQGMIPAILFVFSCQCQERTCMRKEFCIPISLQVYHNTFEGVKFDFFLGK